MNTLMAIDPGNRESAYVELDASTHEPMRFGKVPNGELLAIVDSYAGPLFIEMVASYGMPVGEDVFDTCVWVGRFMEAHLRATGHHAARVKRGPVKLHHCHSSKAKDSNVRQALVDRFAPGEPNYGKGTKAAPGWFYGFRADVWQAYALGVYAIDFAEGLTA